MFGKPETVANCLLNSFGTYRSLLILQVSDGFVLGHYALFSSFLKALCVGVYLVS